MVSPREVATVLIAAAIAATLIPAFVTATDATGTQSVTNESVTADVGNFTELDGWNVNSGETVYWYNSSSGSNETVSSGTDYELDYDNGRIKALASSSTISDGDTLYVTYTYDVTTGTATTVANLVPLFVVLLLLGTLAAKIRL
jgi:hypothetical protein